MKQKPSKFFQRENPTQNDQIQTNYNWEIFEESVQKQINMQREIKSIERGQHWVAGVCWKIWKVPCLGH